MARVGGLVRLCLVLVAIVLVVLFVLTTVFIGAIRSTGSAQVAIFVNPMASPHDIDALSNGLKTAPGVTSVDLRSVSATGVLQELKTGAPSLLPCYAPGCASGPTLIGKVFMVEVPNGWLRSAVVQRFSVQSDVLLVKTAGAAPA